MNEPYPDDLISADFDSETSPQEREAARRLLASSPEAQQELDEIRAVSEMVRSLPRHSAPDELLPSILRRVERESLLPPVRSVEAATATSRTSRRFWIVTVIGVAATAAVLFVTVQFLPGPPEADTVATQTPIRTDTEGAVYLSEQRSLRRTADEPTGAAGAVAGGHVVAFKESRTKSDSGPAAEAAADELNVNQPARPGRFAKMSSVAAGQAPESLSVEKPTGGNRVLAAKSLDDVKWGTVKIGQVLAYLDSRDDRVAVIKFTVVDVRKAVGTVQYLLQKNSVPQIVEERGNKDTEHFAQPEARFEKQSDGVVHAENGVLAVYVETSESQLASTLDDLEKLGGNELIVDLELERPASASRLQVTGGEKAAGPGQHNARKGPAEASETLAEIVQRQVRSLRETQTASPAQSTRTTLHQATADRQRRNGDVRLPETADRDQTPALARAVAPAVAPKPNVALSRLAGLSRTDASEAAAEESKTTAGLSPSVVGQGQQSFQLLVNLPVTSLEERERTERSQPSVGLAISPSNRPAARDRPSPPAPVAAGVPTDAKDDGVRALERDRRLREYFREAAPSGSPIRVLLVFQQRQSAGRVGAQEQ